MRRMLGTIARADVAGLADVSGDHPLREASPSCVRMDVVVGTDARQAWMLAAASSRSAGDDTAHRAEFHPWMVFGMDDEVYSPAVLGLRDHVRPNPHRIRARGRGTTILRSATECGETR
jgi:hypothetical protein